MSKPIIYGLSCQCHPNEGVRYVGKTITDRRLQEHRRAAYSGGTSALSVWIRDHNFIQMTTLDTLPPESTALDLELAEAAWIRFYRSLGKPLLNRTVSTRGKPDPHRPPQPPTPPYFNRKDS